MMLFLIVWVVLIEITCLPARIQTPYFKDENIDSQRGQFTCPNKSQKEQLIFKQGIMFCILRSLYSDKIILNFNW